MLLALLEDIWRRQVRHALTLLMVIVSGIHFFLQAANVIFYAALLLLAIFSLAVWFYGFWGASDSKWLVLSLSWLDLPVWSDWCVLFALFLISYIAINFFAQRLISKFKTVNHHLPQQGLALLLPMNLASLVLILFYR